MIQLPHRSGPKAAPQPSKRWFGRVARAQSQLAPGDGGSASAAVYAADEVRNCLETLTSNKCAYCEKKLSRFDWEVEHFRPKGSVAERADHPGYYWLAYEWTNLYPACTWCNQRRRPRSQDGTAPKSASKGKADSFPLSDESTRAMGPSENLNEESRLLIDPCGENPEALLRYGVDGKIHPRRYDRKAKTTIQTLHLFEFRLCEERKDTIGIVASLLEILRAPGLPADARDGIVGIIDNLCSNEGEFAGTARYVVNNPNEFGVKG